MDRPFLQCRFSKFVRFLTFGFVPVNGHNAQSLPSKTNQGPFATFLDP